MFNERLLNAIAAISDLVDCSSLNEEIRLEKASQIMADLVRVDDWLPDAMAVPHPQYYQQHLLFGDPRDRYSLVSFVWGPGQKTPVHDHTVWGVIGMLRGSECEQSFEIRKGELRPVGVERTLSPGEVSCISPTIGDIHRVRNAHEDTVSISIHLYGGNIGRIKRSVYDTEAGVIKPFVSGYSNSFTPNLWSQNKPV